MEQHGDDLPQVFAVLLAGLSLAWNLQGFDRQLAVLCSVLCALCSLSLHPWTIQCLRLLASVALWGFLGFFFNPTLHLITT